MLPLLGVSCAGHASVQLKEPSGAICSCQDATPEPVSLAVPETVWAPCRSLGMDTDPAGGVLSTCTVIVAVGAAPGGSVLSLNCARTL